MTGFRLASRCGIALLALVGISYGGLVACSLEEEVAMQPRTALSGGAATVHNASPVAFSLSVPGLSPELREDFTFGNRLFNTNWVIAPSSTSKFDGLGPVFNRVSCSSCHFKDGRGQPPATPDAMMESMLIRLSIPGEGKDGAPNPHPVYGDQLQDRSIPGVPAEGYATVSYREIRGTYPDGTSYSLRQPTYHFNKLAFGPLGDDIQISPRVAPSVFGLGLLEAVPEATILALADEHDSNGDGISGRPNRVYNGETGKVELGRFGWKANQPDLRQQLAGAFLGDIGITTPPHPEQNCTEAQKDCQNAPHGGEPELSEDFLRRLTHYNQLLAVPAARKLDDPQVKRGEKLFYQAQCASCHTPRMKTGDSPIPQLAHQVIHPFTDMLLHDMGEALADNRPDFEATGREWRTPPLWGLGLQQVVNGHTTLLHDGRARNAEEAILWHGGEAEKAKQRFMAMSKPDREALLAFLYSL
jgi:CxxC motif-containing protein (DUF1111 family)